MGEKKKQYTSEIHIGRIIRQQMIKNKISVIGLSRQLDCSRTNVYKILDRHSVDTDTLMKLSLLIGLDFFKIYSAELALKIKEQKKAEL